MATKMYNIITVYSCTMGTKKMRNEQKIKTLKFVTLLRPLLPTDGHVDGSALNLSREMTKNVRMFFMVRIASRKQSTYRRVATSLHSGMATVHVCSR